MLADVRTARAAMVMDLFCVRSGGEMKRALPVVFECRERVGMRRLFSNTQLVEKFATSLVARGRSRTTIVGYVRTVRDFAKHLDGRSLVLAARADIQSFLSAELDRKISRVTMQGTLFALRVFFDFLLLGSLVRINPARQVPPGKAPRRLPRVLSVADVGKLIDAAVTPRDRAILELLYATGCRNAEMRSLRVEDIGLHRRTGKVLGKGDKERVIYFGGKAAHAVRAHVGDRATGRVFEICSKTLGRIVRRGGLARKPGGRSPAHSAALFRHAFA